MSDDHTKRSTSKRRVLFVAEAVTLAHVSRLFVLARSLDRDLYDVHFACDPRYSKLFGGFPFTVHQVFSMPSERFLDALTRIRPIWGRDVLRTYVREEIELLHKIDPDVVVGDLRISLGVSTRVCHKPLATIINAYWSPYARSRFSVPDLAFTRLIGPQLANLIYRFTRPLAFAAHAAPLNRVCREYGVAPISSDLREVFCYGDYTLYPDIPELIRTFDLPPNHRYIGPVLWSPNVDPPLWWDDLPTDRPIIYVTLGTSGNNRLLQVVLRALATLPVTVLAATAGRVQMSSVPDNAFVADYLPGEEASARSNLVVCNGGSPTTYQALASGIPVLGLPSNSDQLLNMDAVERVKAGRGIRSLEASTTSIQRMASEILRQRVYSEAARELAAAIYSFNAAKSFGSCIGALLPPSSECIVQP